VSGDPVSAHFFPDFARSLHQRCKVYNISNQKLAALETNGGDAVEVTGTMKGDTVTVSKVAKK